MNTALQLVFTCIACQQAKPADAFHTHRYRDGARASFRNPTCRDCTNAKRRTWRTTDLEATRQKDAEAYYAKKDRQIRLAPAEWMWKVSRARARRDGTVFTITARDICIPTHCPILGLELLPPGPMRRGAERDRIASLDRLRPADGYVPGNVAVISLRANRLKNDATVEELERIASWMRMRGA